MHIKKHQDSFDAIYLYIKKFFLVILLLLTIYLFYINKDDIISVVSTANYQYGQVVDFEWFVVGLEWHNILAQSTDYKKYIIKSTAIDISRIKWKNKFSGIIVWYDNGKYIIDIKSVKIVDISSANSAIYNKNMQLYINIPSDSQLLKDYDLINYNNVINLKNKKTNIDDVNIWLFDCADCSSKKLTFDFVNSSKLTFSKASDKDRLISKNKIYLPVKIQSTNQFIVYQLSQYLQYVDGDRIYNYINKNISTICNNNIDYITSIDEFTTKYQNNQKFIIVKWITKNRSKYMCQIKINDQNNKFDATLVNFYKLQD